MSASISGFHVALEEDCSEEHAEKLKSAIMQIKGVIAVEPQTTSYTDWAARQQAKNDIVTKMYNVLSE